LAPPGSTRLGFGLVNAYDAVYPTTLPASADFADGFENGVLSPAYETRSNGAGRIQVTGANGPFAGTKHLTLDSSLGAVWPVRLERGHAAPRPLRHGYEDAFIPRARVRRTTMI
jgi:hypothetical protein